MASPSDHLRSVVRGIDSIIPCRAAFSQPYFMTLFPPYFTAHTRITSRSLFRQADFHDSFPEFRLKSHGNRVARRRNGELRLFHNEIRNTGTGKPEKQRIMKTACRSGNSPRIVIPFPA
ncbi:hypothetical protein FAGKG844_290045 [Frankia sp. AgKG'84/4]